MIYGAIMHLPHHNVPVLQYDLWCHYEPLLQCELCHNAPMLEFDS